MEYKTLTVEEVQQIESILILVANTLKKNPTDISLLAMYSIYHARNILDSASNKIF